MSRRSSSASSCSTTSSPTPDGLRRRVLAFLGGDPAKESGVIPAAFNRKEDREKVPLSPGIRAEIARHFAAEIKASGEAFGGAAKGWAAKYGL